MGFRRYIKRGVRMKDIDNVVFTDEILEKYKADSEKITELCKKLDKNKKVQEEYKKFLEGKERIIHFSEQENKQLKDNWKKLKEYIRETKLKEFEKSFGKRYAKTFTQAEVIVCNMIIDKMQELEIGSDSNE